MLRASAIAEKAGFPTSSLVCEGFIGQAATTSVGIGLPNLPVALVPGHVDGQSDEELWENVTSVTLDRVIDNLLTQPAEAAPVNEPSASDTVFTGGFEEVNRFFYENGWGDGLPVVPPTRAKVEAFLGFTDLDANAEVGVLPPDNRAASPWNIAVNGVMAGCRPEYMPVLVALVEAMADTAYGVEHSGNTPGAETLIVANGAIIRDLGFNYEQGVLRDGFQANTAIGRFWRLMLRNVAGFLPHETDKGTYGGTWRVVLAENESVLSKIGWPTIAADQGIGAGESAVTVSRFTGGDCIASVFGHSAEEMLPYLADALVKGTGWQLCFTIGISTGGYKPLLVLSPVLAETIAKSGFSKDDVKDWLFEHARMPAWKFENYIGHWTNLVPGRRSLVDFVNLGKAPGMFAESSDPERLVPIVCDPSDFMIAVAGDPLRTNAFVFAHNGILGFPTSKAVRLPPDWEELLVRAREM